jgi:hypothetical protein
MEIDRLKVLLRETLELFEAKKKATKHAKKIIKKNSEKKNDDGGDKEGKQAPISDGDAEVIKNEYHDFDGLHARIITCMGTEKYNNGDDSAQRGNLRQQALMDPHKSGVDNLSKNDADAWNRCTDGLKSIKKLR